MFVKSLDATVRNLQIFKPPIFKSCLKILAHLCFSQRSSIDYPRIHSCINSSLQTFSYEEQQFRFSCVWQQFSACQQVTMSACTRHRYILAVSVAKSGCRVAFLISSNRNIVHVKYKVLFILYPLPLKPIILCKSTKNKTVSQMLKITEKLLVRSNFILCAWKALVQY